MPSSKHYKQDSYVVCPYYCKEAPVEIKCVGICGTHTLSIFANSKKKDDHKADFCCGNYHACPIAINLYEDGK